MTRRDLLIVGAGPAGMAAATRARRYGLDVVVVDDQPSPGGQIWRSIEAAPARDRILGQAYVEGRKIAEMFRASGAEYMPGAQLWQIEPGFRACFSLNRRAEVIEANSVIFATGAQERPVPFPGWTLPGVFTVGAAQILLKSAGQIPSGPVWIAGSGPLPLLYAVQLLQAGGKIAGYLDTTPPGQWKAALLHLPRALQAWGDIAKGLRWQAILRRHHVPVETGIVEIEAHGAQRLESLRYRTPKGEIIRISAETLLVHEGVVPNLHPALALDCALEWNTAQECFVPRLDDWGESSVADLFIAGDGAGIGGAKAALLRGELAALRIAEKAGRIGVWEVRAAALALRRKLQRELAIRPFLDAFFRPRPQIFAPSDGTIVCRCEEITAGEIRDAAAIGRPGPNQVKAATRAGMGPCQGRQCGYSVARILATLRNCPPSDVGFFHVRPPLKPVTIGELASLHRGKRRRKSGGPFES